MRKPKIEISAVDAPRASIYLVEDVRGWEGSPRKGEYWPLAHVAGGVDKMTVQRKGNTTIIKIVSPEGDSCLEVDGWKRRPMRQYSVRAAPEAKPL